MVDQVRPSRSLLTLDLNLLVVLDVLLRERNVTRAAERIGLSQPAVSASLARLRRHFDDELLARVGNRYEPTPLARRLAELTPFALENVSRVFDAAADFDPATMQRQFTVVVSDYAAAVLGPQIVRVAAEQAPGVRLRLEQTSPYFVDNAVDTLRNVDGLVLPRGFLPELPHLELHQDSWVCLVDAANTQVGEELTDHDLRSLPWVVLYDLPTAYAPVAQQLRMTGVELQIDVVVDSFLSMPFLVAGTDRIALIQRRLARRVAVSMGLRVLVPPLDLIPLAEVFWWHPIHRDDPAHVWLRDAMREAARRLDQPEVIDAIDSQLDQH